MQISVRLFTTLRELAGKGEETLEFRAKSITVKEVLKELAKRHGSAFKEYLYDDRNRVREHLQILVNGRSASLMGDLETRLKEKDVVAVVPPVGGG
ncbi:MAG: MoaD family protein [Candidatus Bathyarchaeota archaeon]|nr:MoaD family protein [Candidatus Bathyarchaeota archaeon]